MTMTMPEKLLYAAALADTLARAPAYEAMVRARTTVLTFRRLLAERDTVKDASLKEALDMLADFAEDT